MLIESEEKNRFTNSIRQNEYNLLKKRFQIHI